MDTQNGWYKPVEESNMSVKKYDGNFKIEVVHRVKRKSVKSTRPLKRAWD